MAEVLVLVIYRIQKLDQSGDVLFEGELIACHCAKDLERERETERLVWVQIAEFYSTQIYVPDTRASRL
jgi:hypothetical protein